MSLSSIIKKIEENNDLKDMKRNLNVLYQHKKDILTTIHNCRGYMEKICCISSKTKESFEFMRNKEQVNTRYNNGVYDDFETFKKDLFFKEKVLARNLKCLYDKMQDDLDELNKEHRNILLDIKKLESDISSLSEYPSPSEVIF